MLLLCDPTIAGGCVAKVVDYSSSKITLTTVSKITLTTVS